MLFNSIAGSGDIVSFDGISITTPPTKTTYTEGDTFDPTGMVVTMSFNNGALNKITNSYTVTPTSMTLGVTSVTISVTFGNETKTATLAVTVQERKSISYSGAYTTKEIIVNGVSYTLYTITGSGTLTVEGTYNDAAIWLCGGGSAGRGGGYWGGAGAYCNSMSSTTLKDSYVITVGSAGAVTSFGSILSSGTAVTNTNSGGTGGSRGTGDGKSKYPFSDSTNFYCHCAGGGGGQDYDYQIYYGTDKGRGTYGNGGTNGGNGSSSGRTGGTYGGGNGGTAGADSSSYTCYANNGSAATFYGSGGGGGGHSSHSQAASSASGSGGAGYQGVVYIRVPL